MAAVPPPPSVCEGGSRPPAACVVQTTSHGGPLQYRAALRPAKASSQIWQWSLFSAGDPWSNCSLAYLAEAFGLGMDYGLRNLHIHAMTALHTTPLCSYLAAHIHEMTTQTSHHTFPAVMTCHEPVCRYRPCCPWLAWPHQLVLPLTSSAAAFVILAEYDMVSHRTIVEA